MVHAGSKAGHKASQHSDLTFERCGGIWQKAALILLGGGQRQASLSGWGGLVCSDRMHGMVVMHFL